MSQYDEDIYDVQLTIPNFGRSPDGHLMPPRLIDTTTLQSQSSSLSPSSSVGVDPLQENPPPQGIPPIDQEGTLMGISSQLPSISTHGSDFSFDEVMGTSPQIGLLSCPLYPNPSFDQLERLKNELEQVGTTVQENVSQLSLHQLYERLGRDEINHLERRVEPPNSCELCMNLVGNWDEYFNCISNHCRIHEDDSGETSASQSRRSSRDSGNGGNGNGGNFTGGGGIPGTGFQNLFPYGDGGNQMNGNSFYSNTGQQYYSHGSSFSNDVGLASLAENYSPDASNSSFEQAVPLEEQVPYSQAPGQPTNREQLRRETQALSGCQHLPQGKITTDLVDSDDDDYSSLQSTFSETPLRPRHRSDSTIFETKRFERMPTKDRQKPLDPHLDGASNRQCKNCHHILNDCALCRLQKPEADRCHVCFDRLGQQQERLGVPTPQNHIYLHDVASSRKLDCRIDPTERDKEPINLTQEGQPKSCPYPISEESEQLNADFDNALTINQPQAGSRAGAKEKALDVLPPILVDLSQQTKLLQDLHRPKPLVSRRRYNALRAKLHVIVEILALRESVKSSVPQPNKRDTTSCSNSIISEQSLLILPRLDLDLGLQEIHSSIYIVLETLNMLKQLTKENASTTLSKHLYDADDEMALMIILIPVLATLLRTPTLQMSSAAFAY
ncbi:putative C2H2 zinc finger domain protein [Aspergillus tanneri]|uniref:Uncharacterized protein n=1 Tax=Aspergillus tanneri TaxID=1220188 RepID=A0A5M9MK56_9EURO|nr:uncharacterized protein ATNIH1004_007139 [Aspergillus tanneri]KAA8645720.1 hypothetical protein ATNIH1004_007139 [Aspergillus tanneri]